MNVGKFLKTTFLVFVLFLFNIAAPPPLVFANSGDLNGDSNVDIFDFNILIAHFGNPYTIFDFNTLVGYFGR